MASFDADLATVVSVWTALGITDPVGDSFRCPLHRDCSGFLKPTKSGHWLYHCEDEPKGQTVATFRARRAGRDGKLNPVEHATWKLRALVEAGVATPAYVSGETLTDRMRDVLGRHAERVEHVWDSFVLLVKCRWITHPGEPVMVCRDFAASWCGVGPEQARHAIEVLKALGLMRHVGTERARNGHDARLWLPKLAVENQPMGLAAVERETVITFNDADDDAEVYTCQRPIITKLKKNPEARLIEEGVFESTRWARFAIPRQYVTFRRKRREATSTSGQGFSLPAPALEREL